MTYLYLTMTENQLVEKLSALEADLQLLAYIRNRDIRHRALSNLMADKLRQLKFRDYPADRLFRILVLGDSVVTALDAVTPEGAVNPDALSTLGVHQAPPHLDYRNLPSQLYERLIAQKLNGIQPWQGDIEFRRFSHPDFAFSGSWTSLPLIERILPSYEKLGLPRYFDFISPARPGDAMEIPIVGRRYVNVVFAKRFDSGKFLIQVDGATVREIDCAAGLTGDQRFVAAVDIYSLNDVVDCREQVNLKDRGPHTLRLVAADVSKPVRIWGIELWDTPSFVVMNGGKSGMNINQLETVLRVTGKYLKPDLALVEANGNDDPKNWAASMAGYSVLVAAFRKARVPALFSIPCLYPYAVYRAIMTRARSVLNACDMPYIDVQKKLELIERTSGTPVSHFVQGDGHLKLPGIALYADELLLPFLNDGAMQDPRFAGDADWR